jgi:hypothetical protein
MAPDDQSDNELAKLLQELETTARDFVSSAGGYPPFGAMIDAAGQVTLLIDQTMVGGGVTADTGRKVLEMVRREVKPPNIRAGAVANMAYVRVGDSGQTSTAIVLSVHHRTGRCIDYAIPFAKAASGEIRFGEPFAGIGQTKLF